MGRANSVWEAVRVKVRHFPHGRICTVRTGELADADLDAMSFCFQVHATKLERLALKKTCMARLTGVKRD